MDASGCMKSLLLAATQYRAAKTAPNAALLQRSLEVRAVLVGGCGWSGAEGDGAAGNMAVAVVPPRLGELFVSSRGPASVVSTSPSSRWSAAARAPEPPGPWRACNRRCLRAPVLSVWTWGNALRDIARGAGGRGRPSDRGDVSVFSSVSGPLLCSFL